MKAIPMGLCLLLLLSLTSPLTRAGNTDLTVAGDQILLNNQPAKLIGLRCSNALISDTTTDHLVEALDLYRSYGVNTVSVFLMGSRFGDVKGYLPDGSLNPVYRDRLERILRATDERGMVTIVGCLYWSTSKAKEDLSGWTQQDADMAVAATARWLADQDFTHVILDPDNEGMAVKAEGWKVESLIRAAKAANPDLVVANNTKQDPPNEDLNMHFGKPEEGKPWFDSESTPKNAPGGYWGRFSKQAHQANGAFYNYSRIGRYTAEMKQEQLRRTRDELTRFNGYVLASTWLQCSPSEGVGGPFTKSGERSDLGSSSDERAPWNTDIDTVHSAAGILWWLEFVRDTYGPAADDSAWRQKARAAVHAAIPQAERDPTRPVYHFRPPAQWMNDICGAVYYQGYYHIFYQFNPFSGDRWGDDYTLWAHARSKDLVHWDDLPWSFLPMKERGERRCNSGCITLDGNGKPVIFYTYVPTDGSLPRQQWGVTPLDDDLIKWQRVKGEPLMAAGTSGVPADVNRGWSDPFVFRSAGRTFVTFKSCGGLVCEARDKELTQWKYAGKMEGVDGECPNFFPLGDKWVLIRSTQPLSYLVGDFDAQTVSFKSTGPVGMMDYGFGKNPPNDRAWTRGLYGTNAFADQAGRRILLGWICGFKSKRGWNGCMSLPRILTLDEDNHLVQTPAPKLKTLRGSHRKIGTLTLNSEEQRLNGVRGDSMEIIAEFAPGDAKAFGLKVRQSEDGKQAVTIRYTNGTLNVAGTDVPLKLDTHSQTLKLHVFLDKSVLEVFVNDGVTSVTRVEYPGEADLGVSVFAENGSATLKSLDAWKMKAIW